MPLKKKIYNTAEYITSDKEISSDDSDKERSDA